MTEPTFDERIAVMQRTLGWLETHPHNAITGFLAADNLGFPVSPHSEKADCFCFLGRLAVEAAIPLEPGPLGKSFYSGPFEAWLAPLGLTTGTIIAHNDGSRGVQKRFADLRHLIEMTAAGMPS